MSAINDVSNTYIAELTARSPMMATYLGLPGGEDRLDDLSPDGLAEGNRLVTRTLAALVAAESGGAQDDVARSVLAERLEVERDLYDSGWAHAALNVIASPLQEIRLVFDLMPNESDDDVAVLTRRMAAVPAALGGYRRSLLAAADQGQVSAVRQIDKCAAQCDTYSGVSGGQGYFTRLAATVNREGSRGPAQTAELTTAAEAANSAYAELGEFLRTQLRARAPQNDAVGRQRYVLASRDSLGGTVDLEETYAWGWNEFLAIEAELTEVAERIAPGAGPAGAAKVLDADPAYQVTGLDGLQAWMQGLSDRAIAELGGTHFEIPTELQTLECRIAPPGGGVGAYYTGPSDDLTRPGRMWWAVEPGREVFSTWRETTVVYHEGVPGHHLQVGTAMYRKDSLNDYQRLLAGSSAYTEGWALYAERLVRELGYLDDDGVLLGVLDSQLFRAARVIVDIGMHLELEIPAGTGFHEGERWNGELGLEFLLARTIADPAHSRDEIDRYLGWPGQAPSYKIGERIWLAGRDGARRRRGAQFDLKAFHTSALNMGGLGLDSLTELLGTL
ncbi:MAG TPA: DUF885 domain-containing protein [Nakamurella sp.]|nr:DUF885 domain-containing protein [Nakamurella sp.]